MSEKKYFIYKPIAYIGLVICLVSIVVPRFMFPDNSLIKIIGMILLGVGLFLIFKGMKEHKL